MKQLVEKVRNGSRFKIDLKRKSMSVDGVVYIANGEIVNEFEYPKDMPAMWEIVEGLYENFKFSYPHEKQNDSYFKALSSDEMTDEQLANGEDRNVAQFRLEMYLLIKGSELKMKDDKHWFWQGTDKDLVVAKEWL